jgi:hypothetical protein
VMKGGDQKDDAEGCDTNPLEDAQWAGIEAELELRVQGVRQKRGAHEKSGEINQPTVFEHGLEPVAKSAVRKPNGSARL